MHVDTYFNPYIAINSNRITDLNVRPKTTKSSNRKQEKNPVTLD